MKRANKFFLGAILNITSTSALYSSSDECIAYKAMLQGNICSSSIQLQQQYYKCLRQDPQWSYYYRWRFCNC